MLAVMAFAAATAECSACGFEQGTRLETRECCLPDGSCDMTSSMAGCIKSQPTRPAISQQGAQIMAAAPTDVMLRAVPVILTEPILLATPPVKILNSALRI